MIDEIADNEVVDRIVQFLYVPSEPSAEPHKMMAGVIFGLSESGKFYRLDGGSLKWHLITLPPVIKKEEV